MPQLGPKYEKEVVAALVVELPTEDPEVLGSSPLGNYAIFINLPLLVRISKPLKLCPIQKRESRDQKLDF